ncbi:MAG: hypothetical protein HC781_07605 [Leptolyngbyaceae cyanobacterium CSU_1_4]|nr:hypothetical protein [Leptolyngbyaceae cyanobacterium CSU_1_4]
MIFPFLLRILVVVKVMEYGWLRTKQTVIDAVIALDSQLQTAFGDRLNQPLASNFSSPLN